MSSTLKYTLTYFALGVSWILITDYFVHSGLDSQKEFALQNIKGLLFVGLTTILVYFLLNRTVRKIEREKREIQHRENIVYKVVENTNQEYCLLDKEGKIEFKRGPITHTKKAKDLRNYLQLVIDIPSDLTHLESLFNKSLESKKELERELETNGKLIRFTFLPLPEQKEVILVLTDLTCEKEQSKKQEMTSQFLNLITQSKDIGYWHWSVADNKTYSSQSLANIIGAKSGEEVPSNIEWIQRIHNEDITRVNESYALHLNGDTDAHEAQYRLLTLDGTYKWLIEYARVIQRSENGEPLEIVGVIIDFDLQKKNESILEEKHELINMMVNNASHEVRGPLARILGLVELYKLMKSQNHSLSFEEIEDILEKVKISSEELDRALVNATQIIESRRS